MDKLIAFKALSNDSRWQILQWLKEPEKNFPGNFEDPYKVGVCVGLIQAKAELCQSTVSHYLALLQQAGLVIAERKGQWTYYRRDEKAINQFIKELKQQM